MYGEIEITFEPTVGRVNCGETVQEPRFPSAEGGCSARGYPACIMRAKAAENASGRVISLLALRFCTAPYRTAPDRHISPIQRQFVIGNRWSASDRLFSVGAVLNG